MTVAHPGGAGPHPLAGAAVGAGGGRRGEGHGPGALRPAGGAGHSGVGVAAAGNYLLERKKKFLLLN